MDAPGQPTRRSRPTALGLSGAFAALAFGGWCTVHGIVSLVASPHQATSDANKGCFEFDPGSVERNTKDLERRVNALSGSSVVPRSQPRLAQPSTVPLTPQQLFDR